MTALSPAQLYSLAIGAGLSPAAATTATAVALAESSGRSDAIGDVALEDATWGPSVGPWQIRSLKAQYGTGGPRDASRLIDPTFNAQSMAQISGSGANFKPWTTFVNGAYKKKLAQVGSTTITPDVTGSSAADTAAQLAAGTSGGSGSVAAGMHGLFGVAGDLFTVAAKLAGGAAAAALVIVGAVHTVK